MATAKIEVTVRRMDEFTAALRDTRALLDEVERLAPLEPRVRDAVVLNSDDVTTRLAGRIVEVCQAVIVVRTEYECCCEDRRHA